MEYDSTEEEEFHMWLKDAEEHGLITNVRYQPAPFVLSDPVKVAEYKQLKTKRKSIVKHLLNGHQYQADFEFMPDFGWYDHDMMAALRISHDGHIWCDVKGTWGNRGGNQEFSMNRKWMYQAHGLYINKVVPTTLFKKTWVPEDARFSRVNKTVRKRYQNMASIQEFMNE